MITNLGRKKTESCFDVTMDSFYDAEISEFFGMHELYSISNKLEKQYTELYKMIDWQF